MSKIKVAFISDIHHLGVNHLKSVFKQFVNPGETESDHILTTTELELSPKWIAFQSKLKKTSREVLLCFDENERFVCAEDQLKYSKHHILLPSEIDCMALIPSRKKLTFADQKKLMYQYSMSRESNILLFWHQLCIPQMI